MARWFVSTWTARRKKERLSFPHRVNAGSVSFRGQQAFVSTTPIIGREASAAGQYSGQVGPVYIEPKHEPGNYDREVFLVLKEFGPTFSRGGDMAMDFLSPDNQVKALEQQGEWR